MTTLGLYPLNDLAFVATVKVANDAGVLTPLLGAATAEAFLSTSKASTATAAADGDPTLVCTPIYTNKPGKFLVRFDASLLDPTLLASLFTAPAEAWCILIFDGDIRVAIELAYEDSLVVAVSS